MFIGSQSCAQLTFARLHRVACVILLARDVLPAGQIACVWYCVLCKENQPSNPRSAGALGTPILFRNISYIPAPAGTRSRLSPTTSQPHEARPFSRGSMQRSNYSLFGCSLRIACLLLYTAARDSPCLYHVTLALNLQKWILHTLCQCIRYQEQNCARVRPVPRDAVTNSNH